MSMPSLCIEGPHPFIDLDMGKYIDADRLCAEIEKIYKSEIQPWLSGVSATSAIYDYVLPLINSLQQEQPEVDLEKEVHNYLKTHHLHIKDGGRVVFDNDDSPNFMCDVRDIARHFAQWGAEHEKEELMKEAVEGKVFMSFAPGHNQMVMADVDLPTNTKVRIIIVKEGEK